MNFIAKTNLDQLTTSLASVEQQMLTASGSQLDQLMRQRATLSVRIAAEEQNRRSLSGKASDTPRNDKKNS